jgi:hypothetical protein
MKDGAMQANPLRNSERSDFRRCPQKWHWRWNEHLVPIELSTGPLVFGTFAHLALAEWYIPGRKRGPHPAETWDAITKDYTDSVRAETLTGFIDDDVEMGWLDARKLGHDLLVNYVQTYGEDEQWEVLWNERPFKQLIPHPDDKTKPVVNYVGTIDLIVRDHAADGRVRYIDHKFMKTIATRHLWIDSQNGGYLAIGTHQLRQEGIIGPKESVRDLIYNFVRKALPPDKPRNDFGEYLNKDGSVSKNQPAPFFERYVVTKTAAERNSQILHIGNEAMIMEKFRTGELPLYKNPTRDCTWDCPFFGLCQVDESGGNTEETKKALFRKEDPYTEYHENATSPKRLREE